MRTPPSLARQIVGCARRNRNRLGIFAAQETRGRAGHLGYLAGFVRVALAAADLLLSRMCRQQEWIARRVMAAVTDEDAVGVMLAIDEQVEADELGRRTDVEIDAINALIGLEIEDDAFAVGGKLPVVL